MGHYLPLVQCDASGLEWRTVIELAKDPVGINEILQGLDTHSINQTALDLPDRVTAKIFLFRTIFRGSGWSFANDPAFMHVSSDPQYWEDRNHAFFEKYKGIDNLHLRWAQTVAAKKAIVGPSGRQWYIPIENKIPWSMLTNYPVQGTGADIVMIARISLRKRLKALGLTECLLVSTVHDSIVVDCPKKYVDIIAKLMYTVYEDIPINFKNLFNYEMSIPFGCEVKVGPNLLHMEKLPYDQIKGN